MAPPKAARQPIQPGADTEQLMEMFILGAIDDYGFSQAEFRVFCHIARRGGKDGTCFASLESMAKVCQMHPDTLSKCLRLLVIQNVVSRERRPGHTTIYKCLPYAQWTPPRNEGAPETKGNPSKPTSGDPKRRGTRPPETKGHEGNPIKGNPMKEENGAIGTASLSPSQFQVSRTPINPNLTLADFADRQHYEIYVIDCIYERVPDASKNMNLWRSLLAAEERADLETLYLLKALAKFDVEIEKGSPIRNPGGWINNMWKKLSEMR